MTVTIDKALAGRAGEGEGMSRTPINKYLDGLDWQALPEQAESDTPYATHEGVLPNNGGGMAISAADALKAQRDIVSGERGFQEVAWSVYRGPIPPGMFVLHKCHNPACINPDHLYIGTAKQNTHDMDVAGRRVSRRHDTYCKRGHPFSEENTLWRTRRDKVQRLCKICSTASNRRAYLKRPKP